jgi:hypothetical protein
VSVDNQAIDVSPLRDDGHVVNDHRLRNGGFEVIAGTALVAREALV